MKRLSVGLGSLAFGLLVAAPFIGGDQVATASPVAHATVSMPSAGPPAGSGYVPTSPVRLLDTRPGFVTVDGTSAGGGPVAEHSTINLTVTGRGGVPATGVGAVVLNVTAVGQTANSYLTIWPTGSPQPLASNLNPNPGIIQPNLVIAKVGAGGAVSIYNNAGSVNLIADIQGWFPSPLGTSYNPLLPARVLDSRPGQPTIDGVAAGAGALGAGATMTVPVTGRAGVPATGVAAVVLNVTATDQTNPTFLTVYPTGTPRPNSSDLNPNPGVTAPNLVIAKVGADGTVSIFNNVGTVNVIADVQGWFPVGPTYTSLDPARVLETRPSFTTVDGQAQGGGPLGAGSTLTFGVLGRAGVPTTGVSAVVLNVTAANQTNDTFLTVYPSGTPRPNASNLNPFPGLVAPNLVIAKVGADGMVTVFNNVGSVDVIADVHGWFAIEEDGPSTDITVGDDSAMVAEDAAATAINVLANDVDALGGAVTIASASQPANGLVALTGGTAGARTGLTYEPNANYCNAPPGTALDTFTYTVNDGSSATVTVTVNCVDDGPSAVADAATVAEDDAATAIPVLTNDTDIDAGPKSVASVTQPANGAVVITGGGSGLTYQPDANSCGVDTFTYRLNGGSVGTVTVTVTCVDDLPTAVDDAATVAEDAAAAPIDVLGNDIDDALGPFFIASVTQPADGTVLLTGPVGAETGLTYQPDADFCNTPPPADTFDYTLNGGSVATVSVTVNCVDDAPSATDDGATLTEDDPATAIDVLANDTDIDAGPKTIETASNPANGTVALTGPVGAHTGLTYEPDPDYCNTPPGTTLDTFTYTINGGSVATVTVTVNCVDDLPVAVDDLATVLEDAAATAVPVLTNDTDVDTGTTTIGSVTQPANGTVVITGGGTGLTYAPNANYCNAPPGTTPDTFTYTINGGDSATVSVTVSCADDAPVAVNDPATVAEDSSAFVVVVLTNDTDIDGGPKSVASVTQPANGVVTITGGGTGVDYTPDANYCNAPPGTALDTFTYTLNGGSSATVSMTVTCVDDPPVAVDDSASSSQNAAAVAIDVLANDTDLDGGPKSVASVIQPTNGVVTITGGGISVDYTPALNYCDPSGLAPDTFTYTLTPGTSTATVSVAVACDAPPVAVPDSATVGEDSGANAIDVLTNDTDSDGGPKSVSSVTQPTNGSVAITGGGTGLTYAPNANYCNAPPGTALDTFTYTLNAGSFTTVTVTVTCADDAPVGIDDSATVVEDSVATAIDVLANDTDIDAGLMSVASVTQPTNGSVVITGGGTGVDYTPDANYCNAPPGTTPDTFTYTLNGGSTATVSVSVTCVNDAPTVDMSVTPLVYTENDPPAQIDAGVNVTDPDAGATVSGATVQITSNYAGAEDVLALSNPATHLPITAAVVGDTLTLSNGASLAAYQAALRDVTYTNTSENPSVLTRTVTFTVTDNTALPGSDTRTITVDAVDDPPVAVNDSATMLEDAAATAVAVLTNDTDIDAGPKSVASVTQPANGTVVITGGGTGLTYAPAPNYCNDPPGTTPDTFTYTLTPGSSVATVSITVTCVNDAPIADDETFNGASSAIGNTTFVGDDPSDGAPATPDPTDTSPVTDRPHKTITGDILDGDTDIDGPGPLVITAGTFATNDGGSVTIEADGDFVFEPKAVTSCTDTSDFFDYTVTDQNPVTAGTDTGRVTIAITGCVWYVNNDDAQGNDGTAEKPFDTIGQAETASGVGSTIFVYDGNATYPTGLDLDANQQLIGEAAALTIGADTLHAADAANRPTLTETNVDIVALAAGNTVRGLQLDPQGTGSAIFGGAGDAGGTIDDVLITDTGPAGTEPGLELNGTSGTYNISNLTINNSAATGTTSGSVGVKLLANSGTVNFASAGTISITTNGARGLDAATTNMGTGSVFDDITVTGSGSGGVSMTTTTGTTTFGDGIGTDLALTTISGATAALLLNNAGSISLNATGVDNVSATGGPAIDVTGTTGATLPFDAVSSTGSSTDGINIDGLGTGTFTAVSGSIGGAAGIAFDLNAGSGTVTYPGDLNDGAGATADISNRTGGAVTLSGAINDTDDAGGGVTLSGNGGGGTATFSNSAKILNTVAGNAIVMSTSDNFTLNLTGGGLNIDTTSGKGVEATASGTINITGSSNTIDTTTGVALNISNTDIAATHVTFEHISSNGAANGIVLNTTSNLGHLAVTGTGGTCSSAGTCTGGAIQNATVGISLTSTLGPTFDRMLIVNTAGSGIDGTTTTGFTFTNGKIDNSGTGLGTDTSNIAFNDTGIGTENNLNGVVTITGNTLTNAYYHGIDIFNFNGTISDATISNNVITSSNQGGIAIACGPDPATCSKGAGIRFIAFGSATTVANITKATIDANNVSNFPSGSGIMVQGGNGNAAGPAGTAGTVGSGTNVIAITNNLVKGFSASNRIGTQAIIGVVNGKGQGNYNITGNGTVANPITNVFGTAIAVSSLGNANVSATVANNVIVANNAVGASGIGAGTSSTFGATDTPTLTVSITGNNISATDGNGILATARDATGTLNVSIKTNTVAAPLSGNRNGIRVDSGNDVSANDTVCADIQSNTSAGSGLSPEGIGLRRQAASAAPPANSANFGVEGMAATTTPGVETYVGGLNPGSATNGGTGLNVLLISATTGFSNCSTAP